MKNRFLIGGGTLLASLLFLGAQPAFASNIEVVESVPLETNLAVPGVAQTQKVWLQMISSAQKSLDLEQFYISNKAGASLDPVIHAILDAAHRGVHVRLLVDSKFYKLYPQTVDEVAQTPGCEARQIDFSVYGGVQHSKFFIVDGKESFVGSQNFDWRAISHIHEVGLKVDDAKVASDLESIFQRDWNQGSPDQAKPQSSASFFHGFTLGNPASFFVVASPAQLNPAGIPDTLSNVTQLIAQATHSVKIQVMEYTTRVYGSSTKWHDLDQAIRDAAARGVHVQLMVDISSLKSGSKDLNALAKVPGIQVLVVKIPQYSGGPIPYARIIHSKYMVVDGNVAWVGSENWSRGYFMNTRDVGLVVHDSTAVQQLGQVYDRVWTSGYGRRL